MMLLWALEPRGGLLDDPPPAGELAVRAQVPARDYYVGQGMELRIGVTALDGPIQFSTPVIPGADVDPTAVRTDILTQSVRGIGDEIAQAGTRVLVLRVVPRRPGLLSIPPITVSVGTRQGRTLPLKIEIKPPPQGRPAAFLGGIGDFRLGSGAAPADPRLGQSFEFWIAIDGPAARGSLRSPVVRPRQVGLDASDAAAQPEIVEVGRSSTNDPPTCMFRYRITPREAGSLVIPPVSVAAFDPRERIFLTRTSPSVSVTVRNLERFDTTKVVVDSGSGEQVASRRWFDQETWERFPGDLAAAVFLIISVAWLARECGLWRREWSQAPEVRAARAWRAWERIARGDPGRGHSHSHSHVTSARQTARVLQMAITELCQSPVETRGSLTPEQTRERLIELGTCPRLADRLEELYRACDRTLHGRSGLSRGELLALARQARRPADSRH